jgi:hypothetical protein
LQELAMERTGQADFPHPALGQNFTPSPTARRAQACSGVRAQIGSWAQYHPHWGAGILNEYRRHSKLGSYLLQDTALPDGDNHRPPPNAGEMIWGHLPLVRKLAKARAGCNHSVLDALDAVGMDVLEKEVNRFDPTRGVTFGAFLRKRLAGAMDDWLKYKRVHTVGGAAVTFMDDGGGWVPKGSGYVTANAPKRRRTSTGGYRERAYVETAVQPMGGPRLIPADRLSFEQAMEAALGRLNSRQREVYRGRVLSDPQVPRSVLASRLGIRDERQIPRIEAQARRKMARLLSDGSKVSPP